MAAVFLQQSHSRGRYEKLTNCVSGCDFTTPLFISTDRLFQSDSKVSLQASFIAISCYFFQTVIFFLLHWFVGLEASSGIFFFFFTAVSSALKILPGQNKNTQLFHLCQSWCLHKTNVSPGNCTFSWYSSRRTQGGCSFSVFRTLSHSEQLPKLCNLTQSTLDGTQSLHFPLSVPQLDLKSTGSLDRPG